MRVIDTDSHSPCPTIERPCCSFPRQLRLCILWPYNVLMVEIRQTEAYARWFRRLRTGRPGCELTTAFRRMSLGNLGDVRPVGEGVSEVRIDYGPGYRVYFMQRGETLIVLLAGGDKDSQARDIRRAQELARGL